jgi:cell division protein FtsB
MDSLAPILGSVAISTAAAIGTFLFARRLGLTAVQRTYAEESARLSTTLKARVDVLEAENTRLKAEVARLETENAEMRRRIIVLEHEFAEMKVNEMRSER